MSIDSSVVPEIKIPSPDGKLWYLDLLTGEMTSIDSRVDGQGGLSCSALTNDRAYPPGYDVGEKATIDEYGTLQITHGHSSVDWDGVVDSLQTYPGLTNDSSYPPTYNISGGILCLDQGQDVIDLAPELKWKEVKELYITDIENPTEPSDLKNTKSNIRKIKPDINSELKRV